MPSPAFSEFLAIHYKNPQGLRLGQRFFNLYIKRGSWPEMFYGEDKDTCILIAEWLDAHQYYYKLPPVLQSQPLEPLEPLEPLLKEK